MLLYSYLNCVTAEIISHSLDIDIYIYIEF